MKMTMIKINNKTLKDYKEIIVRKEVHESNCQKHPPQKKRN